jgi:hypothetical protein
MASEPSLDTQLAELRAAAKSLREQQPSWFEQIFHPGRHARRQAEFSTAAVETMKQLIASISNSSAKLAEKEREISELKNEVAQLREHHQESAGTIRNLTDRAAEMRQQFEQVVARHGELGNEFRERIQQVLDEQRVAIRQLWLKASEDAILADRARRATELKLEDLVKRLPPAKK